MTTFTASELAYLRGGGHKARLYLSVLNPATLLAARVNNGSISRGARSIAYDGGSGLFSAILAGQTLWVGTAAGGNDAGRVRVKAISGSAASGTLTVAENSIAWADNMYLTVREEWGLWPVLPRMDSGGTFYKDYDVAYSDQNLYPPPVAIAGPHQAGFLQAGSVAFALDAGDSYAVAPGATITGYLWQCAGGTLSAATSAACTLTVTTAGQYWLTLTVTDSNGKTQSTRRAVWVYDEDNQPVVDFALDELAGDWERGGWQCRLSVYGAATLADYPDLALVMVWAETWYGESRVDLGGNILFTGYIEGDAATQNWDTGGVSFSAASIESRLNNALNRSLSLQAVASPGRWYEYANALTTARALHHLWRWHSTLFEVTDVYLPTDNALLRKYADFEQGTLYGQAEQLARQSGIGAHAVTNRQGAVVVETDAQLLSVAGRAALGTVMAITAADRQGDITITRRAPTVARLTLSGLNYDGTDAAGLKSKAPGAAPGPVGGAEQAVERQTLDTQAQTNALCGRYLAAANNPYNDVRVSFAGNYPLDIAPQEWLTVSLTGAETRGAAWSAARLVARSVSRRFDAAAGVLQTDAVFEREAEGPDGVTGDYETIPETGGTAAASEPVGGLLAAGSVRYRLNADTAWTSRSAAATEWVEADPLWQARAASTNPAAAIVYRAGVGSIERSTNAGATWTDVTPADAPPNYWADDPGPAADDCTYALVRGVARAQGRFIALATWQNGAGLYRYWTMVSADDGDTWQWG